MPMFTTETPTMSRLLADAVGSPTGGVWAYGCFPSAEAARNGLRRIVGMSDVIECAPGSVVDQVVHVIGPPDPGEPHVCADDPVFGMDARVDGGNLVVTTAYLRERVHRCAPETHPIGS